jgi:cardiolipin synthase
MASQIVGIILSLVSVFVSLYIVGKKEKPAYKLIWIFLILTFPVFGGIMYILFYTQSNPRKLRKQIDKTLKDTQPFFLLPEHGLEELEQTDASCIHQARYLQKYANFPVYKHTQTKYFSTGEFFFNDVLIELEKAEKYIFLEFFIIREGFMLKSILAILEKKAAAGLDVRVLYDDLGCFLSLPVNFKGYLEKRNIKCQIVNPFRPIVSSLQNNRDHRKIISVDGKVAFTGGMNIGDEYINTVEIYGHWKDSAVKIEGNAAWSLTLIFMQMWNLKTHTPDDYASFYPWENVPCNIESDGYVIAYADNPLDKENVGEHVYIQIINNAKDYVYINTPYLIVDDNLLSALSLAAKSGVDVRIITPFRYDKYLVHITTRSYYHRLVQAGVKVYEYSIGFNHSKTFVSDDIIGTVGTTNLDFRSLYLHFECGVWMYKSSALINVKEDFLKTLPLCHQITLEDCHFGPWQRFVNEVLRLFAPLM